MDSIEMGVCSDAVGCCRMAYGWKTLAQLGNSKIVSYTVHQYLSSIDKRASLTKMWLARWLNVSIACLIIDMDLVLQYK